jgi:hypothetical protein
MSAGSASSDSVPQVPLHFNPKTLRTLLNIKTQVLHRGWLLHRDAGPLAATSSTALAVVASWEGWLRAVRRRRDEFERRALEDTLREPASPDAPDWD